MTATAPTVVGVDGSSTALDAVRWAAYDAKLHHSQLILVSSMCPPANALPPTGYYDALQEESERALAEASAVALHTDESPGLQLSTKVTPEPPIPALLEMSKSARMVVVGNRGIGRINRSLLGSVSSALASHTRCPLTVVRAWSANDSAGRRNVVVGTDGSAASLSALEMAFEQASGRGVDLTAVHAWADGDFTLMQSNQGLEPWGWSDVHSEADRVLAHSLENLREKYPHVRVRPVVVRDRPAHALLDHAQAAQLVVVGTHGRGGFVGMLLGSVSRKVILGATCPVMIVPR
ncbi:UNVERIFIED_CONTAM: nucleotide-binding universal stress UspA family protein [Williamsia faeni]